LRVVLVIDLREEIRLIRRIGLICSLTTNLSGVDCF
jgi:hypothetical protein